MQTNYAGHEQAYQKRRQDPDYAGWSKHGQVAEDWQSIWNPLIQNPAFPSQGKLLELGCGAGNLSIAFAQAGYEVTGVDIAPTAIAWARENAANAKIDAQFIQGNVLDFAELAETPFEAETSFDIVVDGRCLHCMIGGDRAEFLHAAWRVLRDGGILTICTMCNQVPDTPHFQAQFDPPSRCLISNGIATRYIGDSNHILQEVMRAGFRLLQVTVVPPLQAEDLADLRVIAQKCPKV
jgi:2-polyprenyl-3-methyl-5-hydroxy-6-metoxy-1,4-benzoquinol methylase